MFTAPFYRRKNNTIEVTVTNFFYPDLMTGAPTPLDVYLGTLGPLRHYVYQASHPGPLTNISPLLNETNGNVMDNAEPATAGSPSSPIAMRRLLHSILIVEMHRLADVIKALEKDLVSMVPDDTRIRSGPSGALLYFQ